MNFPGPLDAQKFLADYWQKQPLLLPNAVAGLQPRISPQDLAWLATQEDVESRLVVVRDVDGETTYTVDHGPFDAEQLGGLPSSNWSLLVQDVDKHLPEFRTWLDSVDFIPDWRIDDLMISVAAPGGSVGPHLDNYDVFLCQSSGIRDWTIEDSMNTSPDEKSTELALLLPFDGTHSHLLNENDALYLPPGTPHWGIAQTLCITCSIGMRAPSNVELELTRERLEVDGEAQKNAAESGQNDKRYSDSDLITDESIPGKISHRAVSRAREQGLLDSKISEHSLARILGVTVTDPKAWLDPEKLSEATAVQCLRNADVKATWEVHGMARLAWYESRETRLVFVNGSWLGVDESMLAAFREMCATRKIMPELHEEKLVLWLLRKGCLDLQACETDGVFV